METKQALARLSSVSTVNIMGVEIAAIDMDRLLEFTNENIGALSGEYICVSNVHTTVMSYEDKEYRDIQNGAVLAIPDGGPLSTVGRRRGYQMSRTTGPSYMEEILKLSSGKGYRHYFFGSTQETLERMKERIMAEDPDIRIVGMFSPPFRAMTEEEDQTIIREINAASPDFLWVGLGAPKQEKWMAAHRGIVTGLMVGVGAAFDYYAGNIKRAPEWMQKINLEWLYRLIQDPKRLMKRYIVTNTKFLWNAVVRGK